MVAVNEDQTQQMSAQAIPMEALEANGQEAGLEPLVDGVLQQIQQEPEVDEEVELTGAERAHRLTFLEVPGQQEGQPDSSATIVYAEDGDGLVAELAYSAPADSYDEALATQMLEQAGFDPDSEPPALPAPPPAPEGEGQGGTDGATTGTEDGADGATTEEESSPEG